MSDRDVDADLAADAAEAANLRKLQAVDACRYIVRGCMRGITASALFEPLTVIAASGYTLTDLASELLLLSAQQKGRIGYEEAKSAVLNLYGLVHEHLLDRMKEIEREMEREDLARKPRPTRKGDVN